MTDRSPKHSVDWPRGPSDILGGLILPLPFLIYGIACCVQQKGWIPSGRNLPGSRFLMEVTGTTAIALGVCSVAIAILIHARFLWRNWFGYWRTAGCIEAMALLVFVVAMFVVIITYVASGRA